MRFSIKGGALLATLVAISACQRDLPEEVATPKPVVVAPASQPLTVQDVQIGANPIEAQPLTTDKPIQISISIKGSVLKASQLKAKLFNLRQGQVVGEQMRRIGDMSAPSKIDFNFENPKGWEPGRYLLELTLDGKLLKHQELDVFQPQDETSKPTTPP